MTPDAAESALVSPVPDLIPRAPPPDGATWATVRELVLEELQAEADEAAEACFDFRIDPPPVHRVIPAEDAPPLPAAASRAPVFVFDLADKPLLVPMAAAPPPSTARRIVRDGAVTRCINYSLVETAEWQERELQRRARQVLPRPPKAARLRSKKLLALIGEEA